MFRTFVVGLGRAGAGLHIPVVCAARDRPPGRDLISPDPIIGYDPHPAVPVPAGTVQVGSLAQAAGLLDPGRTVVHVCTPPTERAGLLVELAELGFRSIIVEKPLALDEAGVAEVLRVGREYRLNLVVVAQWLTSELTRRFAEAVTGGAFGALTSLRILQHKPRFVRSARNDGHPTAFDVELPHGLGVALALAGDAEVVGATGTDLEFGDVRVPRMGRAELTVAHAGGVRTELISDLSAPVRQRQLTAVFADATLTGHYAISETEEYAQLFTATDDGERREVFLDRSLDAFVVRAYRHFDGGPALSTVDINARVVELLATAKRIAAGTSSGRARHAAVPAGA